MFGGDRRGWGRDPSLRKCTALTGTTELGQGEGKVEEGTIHGSGLQPKSTQEMETSGPQDGKNNRREVESGLFRDTTV